MTEINLDTKSLLQVKSLNNSIPLSNMDLMKFQIDTSPSNRILLMSETEASIEIFVTCSLPGNYMIIIPLIPSCTYAYIDNLIVIVNVVNPRIRFDLPEIDFGLLGVGDVIKKILCFTNESDVAIKYHFTSTSRTNNDNNNNNNNNNDIIPSMIRTPSKNKLSTKSSMSNLYQSKGDETSRSNMTDVTQDSFKINGLKTSYISIEPNFGIVAPQGTMSVCINCIAGTNVQRMRGLIECKVTNNDNDNNIIINDNDDDLNNNDNEMNDNYNDTYNDDNNNNCNNNNNNNNNNIISQYITYRCEIQSPKTILLPIHHNLNIMYVGIPTYFKIYLKNICNLPAKFKFERPNGEPKNYKITFRPQKGDLSAKETKKIKIEIIPLIPGFFKDFLACKIMGKGSPLGFSIRGEVSTYASTYLYFYNFI